MSQILNYTDWNDTDYMDQFFSKCIKALSKKLYKIHYSISRNFMKLDMYNYDCSLGTQNAAFIFSNSVWYKTRIYECYFEHIFFNNCLFAKQYIKDLIYNYKKDIKSNIDCYKVITNMYNHYKNCFSENSIIVLPSFKLFKNFRIDNRTLDNVNETKTFIPNLNVDKKFVCGRSVTYLIENTLNVDE